MEDVGGDYSHHGTSNPEEDDILRYLLSDTPSADSTPDNSPPHMFEDSTPDVSPVHWSQDLSGPPVVPQLSELSLDLNPDSLLYGSNFNTDLGFMGSSLTGAPFTPPKESSIVPTHIVPIVQPPSQAIPLVQPPHVQVPIVVEPPPKKNRVSGKKRVRTDAPSVPSPEDNVALPRDTLLNITSQSMERYVETLQTTRQLSTDDQKELKRQKRLIKNRESAQLSRERKRAYIDQLEARIAQLMADNGQLKTDNTTLREALARYQGGDPTVKTESKDVTKSASALQIKMGNLLHVGARSTATAGVCLLIVMFSFGLFMNVNRPNAIIPRLPATTQQGIPSIDMKMFEGSAIAPVEVGLKRNLLEAFPEVSDVSEDNDTDYEQISKFSKALPFETTSTTSSPSNTYTSTQPRQIIRVAGHSSTPTTPPNKTQQKIEIKPAGVFTVSYSPDPASFTNSNGEHSHAEGSNSTFMLFLDPRPDLQDDADIENASTPVSATHENQLQVSTPIAKKSENFPPMIISLVFPEDFANGSNPLLLPEGLNPANSLMEITCQVVDISITTSENPRN